MPTLQRVGLELYYEREGSGPPLLLIPGLASDCQSWAPVRASLARTFSLVLMDIRGVGRSVPHDAPLSVDLLADDAVALLDELGIGRAHLLGHSLGGLVAHRLAARAPARVDRLVLAASGAIDARGAGLLGDLATAREAGLAPQLWFRLLFQWLFRPGFFAEPRRVADAARLAAAYPYPQPEGAFRAQLDAAVDGAPQGGANIAAPTLVLCGALDLLVSKASSRASFADIPDLEWQELGDAAHSLHWDQPAAFAAAVSAFLTASRAASRR